MAVWGKLKYKTVQSQKHCCKEWGLFHYLQDTKNKNKKKGTSGWFLLHLFYFYNCFVLYHTVELWFTQQSCCLRFNQACFDVFDFIFWLEDSATSAGPSTRISSLHSLSWWVILKLPFNSLGLHQLSKHQQLQCRFHCSKERKPKAESCWKSGNHIAHFSSISSKISWVLLQLNSIKPLTVDPIYEHLLDPFMANDPFITNSKHCHPYFLLSQSAVNRDFNNFATFTIITAIIWACIFLLNYYWLLLTILQEVNSTNPPPLKVTQYTIQQLQRPNNGVLLSRKIIIVKNDI